MRGSEIGQGKNVTIKITAIEIRAMDQLSGVCGHHMYPGLSFQLVASVMDGN